MSYSNSSITKRRYSKSSNTKSDELLKIQQERESDGVVKRERESERARERERERSG